MLDEALPEATRHANFDFGTATLVVWANSQFATVFFPFFGFLGKATGRTVRPMWTNEGSKRVVPLEEVPFGGLNDVSLNVGGKIPQKLKFWGLLSMNEKNSNLYNLKTT